MDLILSQASEQRQQVSPSIQAFKLIMMVCAAPVIFIAMLVEVLFMGPAPNDFDL